MCTIESLELLEKHGGTPLPGGRGAQIFGWTFECTSGPMAGAAELQELCDNLAAPIPPLPLGPLPEIVFGQNRLTLTHEASGRRISMDAPSALGGWARASAEKGSAGVQVPMASLP